MTVLKLTLHRTHTAQISVPWKRSTSKIYWAFFVVFFYLYYCLFITGFWHTLACSFNTNLEPIWVILQNMNLVKSFAWLFLGVAGHPLHFCLGMTEKLTQFCSCYMLCCLFCGDTSGADRKHCIEKDWAESVRSMLQIINPTLFILCNFTSTASLCISRGPPTTLCLRLPPLATHTD